MIAKRFVRLSAKRKHDHKKGVLSLHSRNELVSIRFCESVVFMCDGISMALSYIRAMFYDISPLSCGREFVFPMSSSDDEVITSVLFPKDKSK